MILKFEKVCSLSSWNSGNIKFYLLLRYERKSSSQLWNVEEREPYEGETCFAMKKDLITPEKNITSQANLIVSFLIENFRSSWVDEATLLDYSNFLALERNFPESRNKMCENFPKIYFSPVVTEGKFLILVTFSYFSPQIYLTSFPKLRRTRGKSSEHLASIAKH